MSPTAIAVSPIGLNSDVSLQISKPLNFLHQIPEFHKKDRSYKKPEITRENVGHSEPYEHRQIVNKEHDFV